MILEIEDAIKEYLSRKGFVPFLVTYTEASRVSLLRITFSFPEDYDNFIILEKLSKRCDPTGIFYFPETLTVNLTSHALKDFLKNVQANS